MNKKKLVYHKNNIEQAEIEVERLLPTHSRALVAILKALLWSVGFILDEMEKGRNNDK